MPLLPPAQLRPVPGLVRRVARRARGLLARLALAVAHIEERAIPGPGGRLRVRIYTPRGLEPSPILVFLHGGGWWSGSIEEAELACRALATASGRIVLAPAYRLAPAHPFPAAAEDAYAAVCWAANHAAAFGAVAADLAVGGESAGGNLAAAAALMARDRGAPEVGRQLLIYPVIDHRLAAASYDESASHGPTRAEMAELWGQYLAGADGAHAHASPLLAPVLAGLPPALVITAELDTLRDEGEAYAERLRRSGVPASAARFGGVGHGFFSPRTAAGRRAIRRAGEFLRSPPPAGG